MPSPKPADRTSPQHPKSPQWRQAENATAEAFATAGQKGEAAPGEMQIVKEDNKEAERCDCGRDCAIPVKQEFDKSQVMNGTRSVASTIYSVAAHCI